MSIVYCSVTKNGVLLEEVGTRTELRTIADQLLQKLLPMPSQKKSFIHEGYIFNLLVEGEVVFLCVAEEKMQNRICFAYLERIRQIFDPRRMQQPPPGFKKILKKEMDTYNDPNSDRIRSLQQKVDEVKGVMLENIDKVLERGQKLEEVLNRSENLSVHASAFRKKSSALKRQMCMGNFKLTAVIIVIALLVVLFIVIGFCGITFSSCGAGSSPSTSPSTSLSPISSLSSISVTPTPTISPSQ